MIRMERRRHREEIEKLLECEERIEGDRQRERERERETDCSNGEEM